MGKSRPVKILSGYTALIGRPNVGKSTLLNCLLGQKIVITSHKPQTTRHRILGVKTTDTSQIVYIDTPGIHERGEKALNKYLNKVAISSLQGIDLIIFVCQALIWNKEDEKVLRLVSDNKIPCLLAVNKTDTATPKEKLLPFISEISSKYSFLDVLPISAQKGTGIKDLEKIVQRNMKHDFLLFPKNQLSDKSSHFFAAEFLREQLFRRYNQEIPYAISVEIESFKESNGKIIIGALIWVEKENQRRIILGSKGSALKEVAIAARKQMSIFFDLRIHLDIWIKVRKSWSSNENFIKQLGYSDEL